MGIVLDPTKCFPSHPAEEILEEYAFHRLPEALAAQVEEHLLICPKCQDAVTETDRFVAALKVAVREPAPAAKAVDRGWRNFLDAFPRLATGRTSLAPVAVLAVLAFLAVLKYAQKPSAPAAVSLSSMRGLANLSAAPAGKPLQLGIEGADLTPGRQYRVELVDAAGGLVWKGPVTEADGKLVAAMPKPLGAGVYWVRLYGAGSELLREFGLSVE